jgi:MOSC domain-containing protein YiiM
MRTEPTLNVGTQTGNHAKKFARLFSLGSAKGQYAQVLQSGRIEVHEPV